MINLIGISGKARSGKDTLARHLAALGYQQLAFASGVKNVTALLAGEPLELFHDDVAKEAHSSNLGMTRRRAMQNVGNGLRDAVGPNVWIRPLMAQWEASAQAPTVVSDVRYPNEAEAIRAAGGLVIRIERSNAAGLVGEAASHVSEAPLPDHLIDLVVSNNGSIEDLREIARTVVNKG